MTNDPNFVPPPPPIVCFGHSRVYPPSTMKTRSYMMDEGKEEEKGEYRMQSTPLRV